MKLLLLEDGRAPRTLATLHPKTDRGLTWAVIEAADLRFGRTGWRPVQDRFAPCLSALASNGARLLVEENPEPVFPFLRGVAL